MQRSLYKINNNDYNNNNNKDNKKREKLPAPDQLTGHSQDRHRPVQPSLEAQVLSHIPARLKYQTVRSAVGKIVKEKSIDPAQASKKTSGPGNLAHYFELLKHKDGFSDSEDAGDEM